MDSESILAALVELAREVGLVIRPMPAAMDVAQHGGGSLVKLRGQEILFLDDSATAAEQIQAVGAALRGRAAIEDRFLPPEIRSAIENA